MARDRHSSAQESSDILGKQNSDRVQFFRLADFHQTNRCYHTIRIIPYRVGVQSNTIGTFPSKTCTSKCHGGKRLESSDILGKQNWECSSSALLTYIKPIVAIIPLELYHTTPGRRAEKHNWDFYQQNMHFSSSLSKCHSGKSSDILGKQNYIGIIPYHTIGIVVKQNWDFYQQNMHQQMPRWRAVTFLKLRVRFFRLADFHQANDLSTVAIIPLQSNHTNALEPYHTIASESYHTIPLELNHTKTLHWNHTIPLDWNHSIPYHCIGIPPYNIIKLESYHTIPLH